MGHPAINDVGGTHAVFHRTQGATDFRQHAAVDGAVFDQVVDLLRGQASQHLVVLALQAGDVGQQDQLLRLHGLGHLAGYQVCVDIVGSTVRADTDGRNHRNHVAAGEHVDHIHIHAGHFADMADINDFRAFQLRGTIHHFQLAGADQVGVFTGQAHGGAALGVDQGNDFLVDLAAKHHLYHVHGLGVGHPHAVHKAGLDVQPLQQFTDLGATTVHHDGIDTNQLHQHHVAGEAALQVFVFHGVAAVFDHNRFAGKPLDIGQAPAEYRGHLHCCFTIQRHGDVLILTVREWFESEFGHQVRCRLLQLFPEHGLDPLQGVFVFGLEPQHQHRRGVGCPAQAPAIGVVYPQAVNGTDVAVAEVSLLLQAFDNGKLVALGNLYIQLRGADVFREVFEHLIAVAIFNPQDFQQAGGGIQAVIKAV